MRQLTSPRYASSPGSFEFCDDATGVANFCEGRSHCWPVYGERSGTSEPSGFAYRLISKLDGRKNCQQRERVRLLERSGSQFTKRSSLSGLHSRGVPAYFRGSASHHGLPQSVDTEGARFPTLRASL